MVLARKTKITKTIRQGRTIGGGKKRTTVTRTYSQGILPAKRRPAPKPVTRVRAVKPEVSPFFNIVGASSHTHYSGQFPKASKVGGDQTMNVTYNPAPEVKKKKK